MLPELLTVPEDRSSEPGGAFVGGPETVRLIPGEFGKTLLSKRVIRPISVTPTSTGARLVDTPVNCEFVATTTMSPSAAGTLEITNVPSGFVTAERPRPTA